MRVAALFVASLVALAACSAHRTNVAAASDVAPLHPCEVRTLTLDGVVVIVSANADGTPASIGAGGGGAARERALRSARERFGAPKRQSASMVVPSKWGLAAVTDRCGRPMAPSLPH